MLVIVVTLLKSTISVNILIHLVVSSIIYNFELFKSELKLANGTLDLCYMKEPN